MTTTLNDLEQLAQDPDYFYYSVVVVEGEPPKLFSFPVRNDLILWYKNLKLDEGYVFFFKGHRLLMTSGKFPYLVDGEHYPLFEPPSPGPVTDEASITELLGLDPDYATLTPLYQDGEDDE